MFSCALLLRAAGQRRSAGVTLLRDDTLDPRILAGLGAALVSGMGAAGFKHARSWGFWGLAATLLLQQLQLQDYKLLAFP